MNQVKQPIYIIIPVHNRKIITLKCLESLQENDSLNKYNVIVVDDGSSDNTTEAIKDLYPDVITLLGDGNLWWTGAIKLGMEYAYHQGAEYFIWLNDDTIPSPFAIDNLVAKCQEFPQHILSAQSYSDSDLTIPTYQGKIISKFLITIPINPDKNKSIICDFLCGNFIGFPRDIVTKIGYPNAKKAPHYQGDALYTFKAKQAGYTLEVLIDITAISQDNYGDSSWLTSEVSILKIWCNFLSIKSPYYLPAYWHLCITFWGVFGIIAFVKPYLRLTIISLVKIIIPRQIIYRIKPKLESIKQSNFLWKLLIMDLF